MFVDIKAADLG